MSYGLKVEVWGSYALFTRPELKVERMTYEMMTPSAARGLIESIYWHPGLQIKIDRIYLLPPMGSDDRDKDPIRFDSIRRNEINKKGSIKAMKKMMEGGPEEYIAASQQRVQRAALVLRDVHYVIAAHFELTDKANPSDNEGKFADIFRRRLEKGQMYSQPYLGTREFPAHFQAWKELEIPTVHVTRDLGLMLYDMDYSNLKDIVPMFFHAELKDGVMEVSGKEIYK